MLGNAGPGKIDRLKLSFSRFCIYMNSNNFVEFSKGSSHFHNTLNIVLLSIYVLNESFRSRYLAIVHPLQPHLSKRKAISTIVVIWLISIALGTPNLLYSAIVSYRYATQLRIYSFTSNRILILFTCFDCLFPLYEYNILILV